LHSESSFLFTSCFIAHLNIPGVFIQYSEGPRKGIMLAHFSHTKSSFMASREAVRRTSFGKWNQGWDGRDHV